MSLTFFHGRAFFDSFVPCIIGKVFYLETHEVLGYFPNHREEIVCTSIFECFCKRLRKSRGLGRGYVEFLDPSLI